MKPRMQRKDLMGKTDVLNAVMELLSKSNLSSEDIL